MALWGKTDASGSKPKYLSTADAANAVFVSVEEAVLKTNKDKGITGAGWWLVREYTDSEGAQRYKTELLTAMSVANADSSDAADDAKVADAEVTITVVAHPVNASIAAGAAISFSVSASASSGSMTYQWQRKDATTGARWTNVVGATESSFIQGGASVANDNGDQYRVVMSSSSGAVKVTSSAANLIVTA